MELKVCVFQPALSIYVCGPYIVVSPVSKVGGTVVLDVFFIFIVKSTRGEPSTAATLKARLLMSPAVIPCAPNSLARISI